MIQDQQLVGSKRDPPMLIQQPMPLLLAEQGEQADFGKIGCFGGALRNHPGLPTWFKKQSLPKCQSWLIDA
ncbi:MULTISPECIES: hypothetical protein [unclassified Synechococcus]|uniref:hypothetical protein n=1 Tax=unclassified Synechococcus TaxID=2626047 RepID=UPI0020CE3CEF|nr:MULTISPECIES: hypothetical protein [unclassified Synechococcus]